MQKKYIFIFFLFLLFFNAKSQVSHVYGYLTDFESGSPLRNAVIKVNGKIATLSDESGYYWVEAVNGQVIEFDKNGYNSSTFLIPEEQYYIRLDTSLVHQTILENDNSKGIYSPEDIYRAEGVALKVPSELVVEAPTILAEADIAKTLQLLPGIQQGAEGFSNLYVRGGTSDQNIIRMNGIPVYSTTHAFGFIFSPIPEAFDNIAVSSYGLSSREGGRLSSVLDLDMKDGSSLENNAKFVQTAASMKFTMNGPISENVTYNINLRRTYLDLFINSSEEGGEFFNYNFFDLQAKFKAKLSKFSTLEFGTSIGTDNLKAGFAADTANFDSTQQNEVENILYRIQNRWGSRMAFVKFENLITSKRKVNLSVAYSDYFFKQSFREGIFYLNNFNNGQAETFNQEYNSYNRDYITKLDFNLVKNNKTYTYFGFENIIHQAKPGYAINESKNVPNTNDVTEEAGYKNNIIANVFAPYIGQHTYLNSQLILDYGIRAPLFLSKNFNAIYLEPRFSLAYLLNNESRIHFSFDVNNQFLHLISNTGTDLNFLRWVPADDQVKPQKSRQVNVGFVTNVNKVWGLEGNFYYKWMPYISTISPYSNSVGLNDGWQANLITGSGRVIGGDLIATFKKEGFSGWIGYSLTNSRRTFDILNLGEEFPIGLNMQHSFKTYINYQINNSFSFSFTQIIGSGILFALPESKYRDINGDLVYDLGTIGNYETKPYVRSDIGIKFERSGRSYGNHFIILNIYNFLGYRNITNVIVEQVENSTKFAATGVSLFRFVPGIQYIIEF